MNYRHLSLAVVSLLLCFGVLAVSSVDASVSISSIDQVVSAYEIEVGQAEWNSRRAARGVLTNYHAVVSAQCEEVKSAVRDGVTTGRLRHVDYDDIEKALGVAHRDALEQLNAIAQRRRAFALRQACYYIGKLREKRVPAAERKDYVTVEKIDGIIYELLRHPEFHYSLGRDTRPERASSKRKRDR